MNLHRFLHARKWLGWLLIVGGGLLLLIGDSQSHLGIVWGNLIVGSTIALSLTLVVIYAKMKRSPSLLPTALLDLVGFLARAACAVTGALCVWAGLWSMTCALFGLALLILPEYGVLDVPLSDNGDADEQNAGTIWAHMVIDGDGINIPHFKERPGSLDDEPMSRVLVACHQNQLRVLSWPEGVCIDDDPGSVEVLVADVQGHQPSTARGGCLVT